MPIDLDFLRNFTLSLYLIIIYGVTYFILSATQKSRFRKVGLVLGFLGILVLISVLFGLILSFLHISIRSFQTEGHLLSLVDKKLLYINFLIDGVLYFWAFRLQARFFPRKKFFITLFILQFITLLTGWLGIFVYMCSQGC